MPFQATLPETIEGNEHQLRDQLQAAAVYGYGVRRRIQENGGEASESDIADARSAIDFINQFDQIAQQLEAGVREQAAAEAAARGAAGPAVATQLIGNPDRRSAGELFVEAERYSATAGDQRGQFNFGATSLEVEMGGSIFADNTSDWRQMTEAQMRTLVDSGTTDQTSGDAGMWRPVGQPIAPVPRQQRFFVRDVIAVQGTGLSSVPYIREYDPTAYELGASAVLEAATKPEVELVFDTDDAPIRKIAAWIPATTEILDDAPTLRGYIDTRLAYMLALREERDILNGDGAGGRLKGILQFTDVQTQSYVNTDVAETVAAAIGKIELVEGDPDGIAMNPVKYWAAIAKRSANQFDAGFGTGSPFNAPQGTLWGLPVIRTRSLVAAQAVVGSWRLGATLFDRMRTVIRVGNQHSTYFTENKVAILAEERVGLAVHRPDFFVDTTVA